MTNEQIEELEAAAERVVKQTINYPPVTYQLANGVLQMATRHADLERLREAVERFKRDSYCRMGEAAGMWERIVEPSLAKLTPNT